MCAVVAICLQTGSHQNCEHDFDGSGGDIAHSWNAGNMHFDDEENFKSIHSYSDDGIYLLRVAVHEIGHVLGLNHTNKTYSIMYAYHATELTPEFELSWDDRNDIQNIYGELWQVLLAFTNLQMKKPYNMEYVFTFCQMTVKMHTSLHKLNVNYQLDTYC